jgi:hypothetical protein
MACLLQKGDLLRERDIKNVLHPSPGIEFDAESPSIKGNVFLVILLLSFNKDKNLCLN